MRQHVSAVQWVSSARGLEDLIVLSSVHVYCVTATGGQLRSARARVTRGERGGGPGGGGERTQLLSLLVSAQAVAPGKAQVQTQVEPLPSGTAHVPTLFRQVMRLEPRFWKPRCPAEEEGSSSRTAGRVKGGCNVMWDAPLSDPSITRCTRCTRFIAGAIDECRSERCLVAWRGPLLRTHIQAGELRG